MLIFIFFVAFAHNVLIAASNDTTNDVMEAINYFEASRAKNIADPPEIMVPTSDIFPRTHNVHPDVARRELYHEEGELSDSTEADYINKKVNHAIDQRRVYNEMLKNMIDSKRKNLVAPKYRREEYGTDKRRIMNWFKNIFGGVETTTAAKGDRRDLRTPSIDSNLTIVLDKLATVLEKLNDNIQSQNLRSNRTSGFFIVKTPIKTDAYKDIEGNARRKREAKNATVMIMNEPTKNSTNVANDNNMPIPTRRSSDAMMDKFQLITNAQNYLMNEKQDVNKISNNEIKSKLVEHLKGSFEDIKTKIGTLAEIKELYSGDNSYRIGYIMANIDTLDLNLTKLRLELENNKYIWDERKLLDLFDRLKSSDHVISKLIDYAKSYAKKL